MIISKQLRTTLALALSLLLTACGGGSKLLKEPIAMEFEHPLAAVSDEALNATLEWVIVKDGPGTWAKNAWWDQYLLQIENTGEKPLMITNVQVVDSLDTKLDPATDRKSLVRASKQTRKRYRDEDIDVRPGAGVGTIVAVGTGTMIYGVGMAASIAIAEVITPVATLGTGTFTASSVATSMATAGMVAGPVLIVGGIVKAVNNEKVDDEIAARHTPLPFELEPGAVQNIDVFFPVAPSPSRVSVSYLSGEESGVIDIPTAAPLSGLHMTPPRDAEDAPVAAGLPN